MNVTWQDAVTAGIVLVALGYLARCLVQLVRRKGLPGCGCCCTKCTPEPPENEKPLVSIDRRPEE